MVISGMQLYTVDLVIINYYYFLWILSPSL